MTTSPSRPAPQVATPEVLARAEALYEQSRRRVSGRPPWAKLNPADPYDMGMRAEAIRQAEETIIVTFDAPGAEDFRNLWDAEAWCDRAGFSYGSLQAGEPRGILFGDFCIAKWRNLRANEKATLHGQMDGRRGTPVTITIYGHSPDLALNAARSALAIAQGATPAGGANPEEKP